MKLLISLVFTFFGLTAFSQAQAIKMKHYSWNNPQHHFNEVLTENGDYHLCYYLYEMNGMYGTPDLNEEYKDIKRTKNNRRHYFTCNRNFD